MNVFPFIYGIEILISSFTVNQSAPDNSMLSLIFCILNIFITFPLIMKALSHERIPEIRSYVTLGFILRVCILFWNTFMNRVFPLPNSDGDAVFYASKAGSYAFGARRGLVDYTDFPYYVSLLYRVMGIQEMNVQFLHVFYAVCSILLINKILIMLDVDDGIRKNAIAFACFLPNTAMIHSFFLYESPLSFLVIVSLYYYTFWWKENRLIYFVLAVLASAAAGFLHMGGVAIAVGFIVSYPIIKNKDRQPRMDAGTLLLAAIMAVVALALLLRFGDVFLRKIGGTVDLDQIQKRASYYEAGGSGYSAGTAEGGGWGSFLLNTPIKFISFIFAPFPWQWRGIPDALAFIGSATFFIYVWKLILEAIEKRKELTAWNAQHECNYGYILVLIVVSIIVGVMFGWGVSNAGSALRHREKYTYVYIVLYALITNMKLERLKNAEKPANV